MRTRMAAATIALGTWAALAVPARAQLHDVEIAVGAGLLDRATAGVGADDDLDHETGLAVDLSLRFFVGERDGRSPADGGRCIHPGIGVRGMHAAGAALGVVGSYAYRTTIVDLAFTLRSACLDLGRWLLTGYGGVSLGFGSPRDALADAGAAAYTAIGGNVGADVSAHFGPFLIGPFLDVRFMAAFGDGPASRLSTAEVGIRFGYELDFPAREEGDPEEGSRWRP